MTSDAPLPGPAARRDDVPWRRAYWLCAAAIVLLALLLRTIPLTYSHFWDETVYLQHARIILGAEDNYSEFNYRPPLLPFLYAAGFLAWDHVYAANVVQGIVTALAVVFGFLYVRVSFGRAPALAAAALVAFTPYLVDRSHDLLTDGPALALMLAAMWAFERPGTRFVLLSGALYALAVQTRFTSLFLAVYFVLQSTVVHRRPRELLPWTLAAAAVVTPYLAWVRVSYGSALHPFVLARRIVTEWTAPVPASFYADALAQIFPSAVWALFALGLAFGARNGSRPRRADGSGGCPGDTPAGNPLARQLVLLAWGAAFLAYMLSIPHKEVRYLLALCIPVLAISSVGLAESALWIARRSKAVRVVGLMVGIAAFVLQFGSPFQRLAGPWMDSSRVEPWVDRSTWEAVQIGKYLNEASGRTDTIYAAHNFPVIAFYSGRRTVSLLPIQENFDAAWRDVMNQSGYLVLFDTEGIKETHSRNPEFKPDRTFVEAHRQFHAVRKFPSATLYRYDRES